MSDAYDVIVIGAGPGGYVAAIRAAQLGFRTACVEKWLTPEGKPALGGTCLNVGCIPSKALLESSERVDMLHHDMPSHGIAVGDVKVDVPAMIERKDKIVTTLTGGIEQLFKANNITWLQGSGQLQADKSVEVTSHDGEKNTVKAAYVILASGSESIELPMAPWLDDRVVDSTGALAWTNTPERLGVIGGGVIGLEMGSVWRRLGAEVTILEAQDDFLATADRDLAKNAAMQFKKQGLKILLGSALQKVDVGDKELILTYSKKGKEETLTVDRLIVAVGRKAHNKSLLSEDCGVALDERGRVVIDARNETAVKGVYAIGDCTTGPMLAHKASEEGIAVAEHIAGQQPQINHHAIPWVIYTHPELAWVGSTEAELKEAGTPYKAGSFSFAANGRAKAMNQANGLIKVLAHADTDRILGVHICGPMASELIAQGVIAIETECASEDLARMCFAHPALSESMHEAMLAVDKRAIHAINK